ncbi:MAG: PASTA domain-containing protein [Paludibacteraceae bacterium]|nr:PASTA domain-containing protein [Paludibacteraceae bacterium]
MSKIIDFFRRHRIFKHICLIVAVSVVLLTVVFYWLGVYTRHGEREVVPEVRSLSLDEAVRSLEAHRMTMVVTDSIYNRNYALGSVVEQDPKPGEFVKPGRRIYVVVNAATHPTVPFPTVVDMSLRQAKALLEGAEFVVKDIVYKPSEYKDLVLSAQYNGKVIREGDRIPVGSSITLCVGKGLEAGDEQQDELGSEIENRIQF